MNSSWTDLVVPPLSVNLPPCSYDLILCDNGTVAHGNVGEQAMAARRLRFDSIS
jgi:hypothetical protein